MQKIKRKQTIKAGLTAVALSFMMTFTIVAPAIAAEPVGAAVTYLEEGVAYVPLRSVGEALGLEVSWDATTRTAYAGSVAYSTVENADGRIVSDRTYVPLSDFAANHKAYYTITGEGAVQFVPIDAVDVDGMMAALEQITETPRYWLSDEIIPTREYIAETLAGYGYAVEDKTFEHIDFEYELLADAIDGNVWTTNPDAYYIEKKVTYTGHNIVATKKTASGQEDSDLLIVGAHYDSVYGAPGANDNGSGLVTMLEVARLVKDLPSDTEIRFVCFDGEEDGLIGSHYYAESLTEDDLARLVGMINFDMLGAQEAEAVLVATSNGEDNYLTGLFDAFELTEQYASDHFSFYGIAVPSVSICHDVIGPYHTPDDVIDYIDSSKLEAAAAQGAAVVSYLMGDAPVSIPDSQGEPKTYTLKDDVKFGVMLDKASVESGLGIEGIQVPVFPETVAYFDTSYTARVSLWGVEIDLRFDYIYNDAILTNVSGVVEDAKTLADELDKRFEKIVYNESVDLSAPADKNSQIWLSDNGNAFILNKEDGKDVLYVSSYEVEKKAAYSNGKITSELNDTETIAWEKLSKLISLTGIEDDITSVTFVKDGFGASDLYISGDFLTSELAINVDPCEIANEQGTLYDDEGLTYAFITGYAQCLFNSNSQIDYELLKNKSGVEYGYLLKDFKTDSYFSKYVEKFGIEIDYDAKYYFVYWQQQDVIAEMSLCLAAYVSGINIYDMEQANIDFFASFPEFAAMKK